MQISVVIPTFNRADLLREALRSVLIQTHKPHQVIVVDDGSTDHSNAVLAEFGNQVQTIRLNHGGISIARNAGIDASTGEYIAFLDSDDLWESSKLEKHINFAMIHPETVMTYTDAIEFTGIGNKKQSFVENFPALTRPDRLFSPMITEFSIPLTSTILIQRAFLQKTGLRFPVEISIGEDLGLFLQILLAGGKFGYLPEKLTMRRMHDSNVSGNHCKRFEQRKLLYTNLLQKPKNLYTPEQRSDLKAGLKDARYRVGECLWGDLKLQQARTEFLHSLDWSAQGLRAMAYSMLTILPKNVILQLRNCKSSDGMEKVPTQDLRR